MPINRLTSKEYVLPKQNESLWDTKSKIILSWGKYVKMYLIVLNKNKGRPSMKKIAHCPLKYCIDNDGVLYDRLDRWIDR